MIHPIRGLLARPKSPRVFTGFTLVELLVVIAVVSLLLVLHAAANPHVKSQSEVAGCLSNLRRLGVAWLMYAADHGGALPGNLDQASALPNQTWCAGWLD